ncbi:MAG: hypothetical protein AMJ89_00080 [candidate division Zixibacteria bacterium SM23_73]|nr:MAG: hypothetical protein AMJ89_00080 [candidate division Zixibacteria bacterium SM23_73]
MISFKFLNVKQISRLPKSSGVYAFFQKKKILYIGKASNIQKRVKNHFKVPGFKDSLFLNKTNKIGYIKTDSEISALLLEAKLIKKHQPKFNTVWRDDKKFFFVGITKPARNAKLNDAGGEQFPKIFISHQTKLQTTNYKPKTKYIGPFVDGKALKQTLKILRKIFPFRSCQRIPKKPCLWYQLKRCPAPCLLRSETGKQIPGFEKKLKQECKNNSKNIIRILKGKKKNVLKDLKRKMKQYSEKKEFEKAARLRDQIFSLEKIFSNAKVIEIENFMISEPESKNWENTKENLKKIFKKEIDKIEAYDISNIQGKEAVGSMIVFIKGMPVKNLYRKFKIRTKQRPDDISMIKEVLERRFLHYEWEFPDLILIDGGKAQLNAARHQVSGTKIPILALAKKNNKLYIEGRKNPVSLKSLPKGIFNLVLQMRDEAHRFAISYHKKLRKKAFFQ